MSAVFLAPPVVEPSIVSDTAQASAPASRVLLDEPGLVARGTGTLSVTFDMGSTAYDTVAAIRNNLPAAATIRVRAASSADMTSGVVLDTTVQAWSGEAPTTKAISYIPLPAIYTERYVRVDLIAVGASLVEVSRIIIGKRIEVDGIDRGATQTAVSGSQVDDGPGWTTVGEARARKKWTANVGNIARLPYYREWAPFLDRMGKHTGFLFIPQTASIGLQQEAVLVRNADDPKVTDLSSERFQIEMSLFEV